MRWIVFGWIVFGWILGGCPQINASEIPLERQPIPALYVTLAEALAASTDIPVSLKDALGEGEGCFDSDPRYSPASVNCMTWLQWVLARGYAGTDQLQFQRNLDALRYYDEVSFAHRKHFVDRWVMYSPEPLVSLKALPCQADKSIEVTLELQKFRDKMGVLDPLYQESSEGVETHVLSYLSTEQATICLEGLAEGYYVGFFVASPTWIERWSQIGSMGLVHSMIVERNASGVFVHHASMDMGRVVREQWTFFHQRLQSVADGYRFFALDPNWSVSTNVPVRTNACSP